MEIKEIINDFIDLNDLRNNKKILAFILYGSYVSKNSSNLSDVDILMILDGNDNYRVAKMFQGLHLDIHALSVPEIERHIVYERANGNEYIASVLRRGEVLINRELTIEYLRSILTVNIGRFKRAVNSSSATLAVDAASDYLESPVDDNFKYFKALEYLRKIVHVKMNVSNIPELKVYKLYSNPSLASEEYLIKLPNSEFRNLYMNALQEKEHSLRKEYIVKILSYLVGIKLDEDAFLEEDVFDDDRMKRVLVSLNHLVITAEDHIIKNTPYANGLYYLTLDRIMNVIKCAYGLILDNAESLFNNAVNETGENERIRYIEELFHIADLKYNLDYDDFVLKL